jgi:hypothetical protein
MEFKSETHKTCYEKTLQMMREIFGEQAMAQDNAPVIGIMIGSAITQVGVHPWGDDDAVINVFSYVVAGADLDQALLRFLLRENCDMRFGAFSIDQDGDIIFSHAIVGSTCDKEELKASVFAVARVADVYDDQIVSRFGGQTALDIMRHKAQV